MLSSSYLLIFILLLPGPLAWAAKAVPPLPPYAVLDETHSFTPGAMHALESLLVEHDRLTGEQMTLGVFQSLDGEDPDTYTKRVYNSWRIGRGSSVYLAFYVKEQSAQIAVGFGLENLLTDEKSKSVLDEAVSPKLASKHLQAAVGTGILEVLKLIQSPLVESGKALEILRSGGFKNTELGFAASGSGAERNGFWAVWLVLGFGLSFSALTLLISAEAHYTSRGWIHPRPWSLLWEKLKKRVNRRNHKALNISKTGGTSGRW